MVGSEMVPSSGQIPMLLAFARRLRHALAASCHRHRWLFAATLGYIAICSVILAHFGRLGALDLTMYTRVMPIAGAILASVACLRLFYALALARPARPILFLIRHIRAGFSAERLANAVPILLVLPPFMSVFTSMKNLLPVLNPYHWDPRLAAWDRALHFGIDPWRLLQPVVGHVWATAALGWLYQIWFLFIVGAWFILAFGTARPRLRMQYLIASVLAWAVIGTFAAIMLSSGGPVYYGRLVGGPDPFAPLMAYLADVHSTTILYPIDAQKYLWDNYVAAHKAIGSGISAMPSMHVAAATMFAFLLRGWHRTLGRLGFVYLGLIMVASVHLGWHYAIDGYVSLATAALLWKATGWIVGRMPEFAETERLPAAQPLPA